MNFVPESVKSPRGPPAVSRLRARGTLEPGAVAGNTPLAAAFALVPIVVMAIYLFGAKRFGAFDAL